MSEPLSAELLLSQGACCGNGCQNCPYLDEQGRRHHKGIRNVAPQWQQWILFDFDGTLANSLPLQQEAYRHIAQRYGRAELSDQDFERVRSMDLKAALKYYQIPLWRVPFLMREGQRFLAGRWGEVQLYPEMGGLLQSLHQAGYSLGIVTSNTKPAVEEVLTRSGVRQLFPVVVAEPHLWGKARTLKKLLRTYRWSPQRVWYVGDETRDLEAAHQAGVNRVGVSWGLNTQALLEATGSPVVTTPQSLLHFLHAHRNLDKNLNGVSTS